MTQDNEEGLCQYHSNPKHNHYLFIDLETGGLYPTKHSILQIAAVMTDLDFKIQGSFMSYVKPHPELEVSEYALSINQLNWDDLKNAPEESYVAAALRQFALLTGGKGRFAGYNCQFDLEFLNLMWKRQAKENNIAVPYNVPWLDIYTFAKTKLGTNAGLPNFKLGSVADYFGINTAGAHDALQDLMMTINIAKKLKEMTGQGNQDETTNLPTTEFSIRQEEVLVQIDNKAILKVENYTEEIVS